LAAIFMVPFLLVEKRRSGDKSRFPIDAELLRAKKPLLAEMRSSAEGHYFMDETQHR